MVRWLRHEGERPSPLLLGVLNFISERAVMCTFFTTLLRLIRRSIQRQNAGKYSYVTKTPSEMTINIVYK